MEAGPSRSRPTKRLRTTEVMNMIENMTDDQDLGILSDSDNDFSADSVSNESSSSGSDDNEWDKHTYNESNQGLAGKGALPSSRGGKKVPAKLVRARATPRSRSNDISIRPTDSGDRASTSPIDENSENIDLDLESRTHLTGGMSP
ncbi:hypothetical protein PoB_000315800 [Plakobranchus ocellatus]|uniref:Uncharacterized protein n=1 Tax=Plakobranchus ocellatus TaxID=259542 RepID=A0AAV3Y1Z0_9GAST|nr:hypothetical protein PoB_000315800 [Plakobranchus ocellatus]